MSQAELAGLPPPWCEDDTQAYLTAFPLPPDFAWPGKDGKPRAVCPSYSIREYGKWLRETPYYPGLFRAVHDVLVRGGDALPDEGQLLAELTRMRTERALTSPF